MSDIGPFRPEDLIGTGDLFDYDPLKRDTIVRPYDPFQGSYSQTHRMRAHCLVYVNGVDITNRLKPHLISVRIVDGNPDKLCEIEIDDRDALMPIPPLNAPVQVHLGWAREDMFRNFSGTIHDFEHGFGRKQGGRRMWVHAKGTNTLTTMLKQPSQDSMGDGAPPGQKEGKKIPLPSWIQHFVTTGGGASPYVNGFFNKFQQDHWDMMGSSPHALAQTLGEKFGAEVQWGEGNKLFFEVPAERGFSCRGVWRDNLIGWRVRPFAARTAWAGSSSQSYNAQDGQWEQRDQKRESSGPSDPGNAAAAMGGAAAAANTVSAAIGQNAGAVGAMEASWKGVGRIAINGEPKAQFNSWIMLEGCRPQVDGSYQIKVAEHIYSRQGYVTWLDVTTWGNAKRGNVFQTWPLPRPGPNIG